MKRKKKKVSTRKVSVLRSIKPYWLYLILTFRKTVEVGKSKPNAENWDGRVFLYCSQDMKSFRRIPKQDQEWMRKYLGKVSCMFTCDHIEEYQQIFIADIKNSSDEQTIKPLLDASQLTLDELKDYTTNQGPFDCVYAWHINGIVQHGYPMELNQFRKACDKRKCDGCEFFNEADMSAYEHSYFVTTCVNAITRPPQTFCYVMGD